MQSQLKTCMLLTYWYNMHVLLNNLSSSNIYFIDTPTLLQSAGTIYFSSQPHIFCKLSLVTTITTEPKQYTVLAWKLYCKQNPHAHCRLQVLHVITFKSVLTMVVIITKTTQKPKNKY